MSAAANYSPRERVSFESNRPQTITLDGDGNPTEQSNRAGEAEYRYFLQDRRIAWLPPHVHDAIQAANAGEWASFEITRRRAPRNWDVIHVEEEPQHGYGEASPTRPQPTPAPQRQQPRAAEPARAPEPTPVSAPKQQQPAKQPDAVNASMYAALCAAIQCAKAAERYAHEIGAAISFSTADIRAIAASLYIHATGGR